MSSPRMLLCRRHSTPLPLMDIEKEVEDALVTESRSEPVWPTVHIDQLNKESVFKFLRYNKELLEAYVMNEVGQDTLEKWTIRKAKVIKKKSGELDTVIPSSLSKWKFCVHTDKRHLMQDLAHSLAEESFILVLHRLCTAIQKAVLATSFHLYEYSSEKKCLLLVYNTELKMDWHPALSVCRGYSVAGYVGWKRETVITSLLYERNDERFPNGLGFYDKSSLAACSILCLPILSVTGELIAVLELIRLAGEVSFHEEEAEIAENYLSWAAVALQQHQQQCSSERCNNQRALSKAVIKIITLGIGTTCDIQAFLCGVAEQCVDVVSGTRVILYLQSADNKDELYPAVEWDNEGEYLTAISSGDRFPVSKGIVGYVFQNGKLVNCSNALSDSHFNQGVDISIPECGSALLCVPLMLNGSVIGVVSVARETSKGDFTADHEQSLVQLCHYATLAYNTRKALDDGRLAEKHLEITNQVLEYHRQCTDNDISDLDTSTAITPDLVAQFPDLLFTSSQLSTQHAIKASASMFMSLAGSLARLFSHDKLLHFLMTVSKNYRPVPYHNWAHGFCVAQTMYAVLQSSTGHFSELEKIALFTASLCHDLDHRGYNNHFYTTMSHPLAMLYSTSVLEQHHFRQAELLLGINRLNIFCHLDPLAYKQVIKWIHNAILATDLSLFSGNMKAVQSQLISGTFDWNNTEHRAYAHSIMMTACDVSSATKPWNIYEKCVEHLMQEFYQQGDEEKRLGNTPLPLMNRDNYLNVPLFQKEFVESICIPCYSVLAELLPNTAPLLVSCRDNNQRWEQNYLP